MSETDLRTLHANWREAERRLDQTPRDHLMRTVRSAVANRALDALIAAAKAAGWSRDQGPLLAWCVARINEQPEHTEGEAA